MSEYDAILVVSFGGPERREDVMPFLENVVRGRNVPTSRLREVARHYEHFGGVSPINEQSRSLVAALEAELSSSGIRLPVYLGNRNWHPYLADSIAAMTADGRTRALALILSAYSSYPGCRQYRSAIDAARAQVEGAPIIDPIRRFFNHPGYLEASVDRIRDALDGFSNLTRDDTHVVFTAHSIPLSMATTSDYEKQLRSNGSWISRELSVSHWHLAWQSRSGPPEVPWLEPDVLEVLSDLAARGVPKVVLAPIGFVSDHMEVAYDLDVEAREHGSRLGIELKRAATVGTHPRFIAGLRELIEERIALRPRLHLGTLPARADVCEATCCPNPVRSAQGRG